MYLEERKCKTYCIGESFILKRPKGREGGGRKRKKTRGVFSFSSFSSERLTCQRGDRGKDQRRGGETVLRFRIVQKSVQKKRKKSFLLQCIWERNIIFGGAISDGQTQQENKRG